MSEYPMTLFDFEQMMTPQWALNNKIGCIKFIRAITGAGLKEAKDFCENMWFPMLIDLENLHEQQNGTKPKSTVNLVDQENMLQRIEALERLMAEIRNTRATVIARDIFKGD